jgi:hypothetical protein
MAVFFQKNEVELKRTGHTVTVPDNDVARLMYYLNCVCEAVQCEQDSEIRRFTNYSDWASLSVDGQKVLLALCYTFSPDTLDDKVFFHSDALCGDSRNEFYEINQVRHQLLAAESIVIAGQTRRVNKIMTYRMEWLEINYLIPMQGLVQKLRSISERPAITYRSSPTPTYTPVSRPTASTPTRQQPTTKKRVFTKGCVLGSLCSLLIVLAIIIAVVVVVMTKK